MKEIVSDVIPEIEKNNLLTGRANFW